MNKLTVANAILLFVSLLLAIRAARVLDKRREAKLQMIAQRDAQSASHYLNYLPHRPGVFRAD